MLLWFNNAASRSWRSLSLSHHRRRRPGSYTYYCQQPRRRENCVDSINNQFKSNNLHGISGTELWFVLHDDDTSSGHSYSPPHPRIVYGGSRGSIDANDRLLSRETGVLVVVGVDRPINPGPISTQVIIWACKTWGREAEISGSDWQTNLHLIGHNIMQCRAVKISD